ncbi:MAG: DciA family protein [Candidatus Dormibacteraceae bacterium]
MDRVGKIIPKVLSQSSNSDFWRRSRVERVVREMLGPLISDEISEFSIERNKLIIATSNPALAHELKREAEVFLKRLNRDAHLPRKISSIQFRITCASSADD